MYYADGQRETLYIGDFVSGAMLAAIVDRAKKLAIKDLLATGERGLSAKHILPADPAKELARTKNSRPSATLTNGPASMAGHAANGSLWCVRSDAATSR